MLITPRFFSPISLTIALAAGVVPVAAQQGAASLRAGPMVGPAEMREVTLWAQTTRPARVRVVYWDSLAPTRRFTTAEVTTAPATAYTAHLVADSVEPGRTYGYELRIDGVAVPRPYPLRFATPPLWQWRTDPPTFRMALASCFYVNDPAFDRPGTPYGSDYGILGALAAAKPDLMVWLGDNTYLREADWSSRRGILHRYTHTRALPELQAALASMSHYATWDDHDFGPNDADASYRDTPLTREAFDLFWPSGRRGVDGGSGVTSTFEWADVQVFLLDNRSYRTANGRLTGTPAMLGERQVAWLINALRASRAAFKLVAVGGQVLNSAPLFENYVNLAAGERERLLRAIQAERIPGVVFLSGDKHWTELNRMERTGAYPLFELTVSSLTAGVSKGFEREMNQYRIPETLLAEHNFGILEFSGPRTDRVMTIRIHDAAGAERWSRQIKASELR
ncbi:MAG TPA: alkaline phosphatase D family protein [Gemmatimonadales bacterium]|nr:alkaline phosphatase D family protein [Gemmatimonadales bacterium]